MPIKITSSVLLQKYNHIEQQIKQVLQISLIIFNLYSFIFNLYKIIKNLLRKSSQKSQFLKLNKFCNLDLAILDILPRK